MPNKYFSFPVYIDKTEEIHQIYTNDNASVYVFLKKEDYTESNALLLRKILQAIELDIDKDVHLLLLENHQDAYILERINLEKELTFIAFGLNAKRLGLQTKTIPYKWMNFGLLSILFSHTLSDLQKNVDFKKKLWALLQQFKK